jgi:hypothetical protein
LPYFPGFNSASTSDFFPRLFSLPGHSSQRAHRDGRRRVQKTYKYSQARQ